jgi:hypothetical protein
MAHKGLTTRTRRIIIAEPSAIKSLRSVSSVIATSLAIFGRGDRPKLMSHCHHCDDPFLFSKRRRACVRACCCRACTGATLIKVNVPICHGEEGPEVSMFLSNSAFSPFRVTPGRGRESHIRRSTTTTYSRLIVVPATREERSWGGEEDRGGSDTHTLAIPGIKVLHTRYDRSILAEGFSRPFGTV